jgi:hypothetical protein
VKVRQRAAALDRHGGPVVLHELGTEPPAATRQAGTEQFGGSEKGLVPTSLPRAAFALRARVMNRGSRGARRSN